MQEDIQTDLFTNDQPPQTTPEVRDNKPEPASEAPPAKLSVRDSISAAVEEVRARDEKGRFARGEEKPEKSPAPGKAVEPTSSDAKPAGHKTAPQSWSTEAKALWDSLPPSIQAEAHRREADTQKGVQSLKSRYDQLDKVLDPYRQSIRSAGRTEDQVVHQLLQWNMALANPNKQLARMAFDQLARAFQIDTSTPAAPQGAQGASYVPPELAQHIQGLTSRVHAHEQQFAQASHAAAEQTVNSWSKDKPHFPAVRQMMAHLVNTDLAAMQRGEQAIGGFVKDGQIDLDAAYNAAIYAQPDIRNLVLAEEQKKREASAKDAVQKARSASVSIRTGTPAAPATANGKTPPKHHTVRDAIKAAIGEVRSR